MMPWFWGEKMPCLFVCINGLNSHWKCSFKKLLEKKHQIFYLWELPLYFVSYLKRLWKRPCPSKAPLPPKSSWMRAFVYIENNLHINKLFRYSTDELVIYMFDESELNRKFGRKNLPSDCQTPKLTKLLPKFSNSFPASSGRFVEITFCFKDPNFAGKIFYMMLKLHKILISLNWTSVSQQT